MLSQTNKRKEIANSTGTYIRVDKKKASATASGKPGYGNNDPQENIASSAVLSLEKGQIVDLYCKDRIQDGDTAAFNGFLLHI